MVGKGFVGCFKDFVFIVRWRLLEGYYIMKILFGI